MNVINVVEARKQFSDLMARVAYNGERIIVERRGKPMMALVSIEDLQRLEELEDVGPARARRRAALDLAAASRERIRSERSGATVPDSAEVLARLREERLSDVKGMH